MSFKCMWCGFRSEYQGDYGCLCEDCSRRYLVANGFIAQDSIQEPVRSAEAPTTETPIESTTHEALPPVSVHTVRLCLQFHEHDMFCCGRPAGHEGKHLLTDLEDRVVVEW